MRKGTQILRVEINDGIVVAYDETESTIKLTRSQRQTLTNYKDQNYISNIQKEWHNKNVVHPDFSVIKNGKVVYTYTK